MRYLNNNQQAFFALLKAGLWERKVFLLPYGEIDFQEIYSLAQQQSVVGIISAGLEHVADVKPSKDNLLTFVGDTLQLERRNTAMNYFISVIVEKLQKSGIEAILVKGQGVAQCYERPLWRACGDVDLLLDSNNYEKAKNLLIPMASSVEDEDFERLHLGMTIDPWVIELHGTLYGYLWRRAEATIDEIISDTLSNNKVRLWDNSTVKVKLPTQDNDIVIVFTHILQHFFTEGVGLRQICDWSRLLWIFRDEIDNELLKERMLLAGIMSEWQAFAALAAEYIGIPVEAIPFYSEEQKWKRKAEKIIGLILETGNFGHNRDNSHYQKYPYLVYKTVSLFRNTRDSMKHFAIFPIDATKVWWIRLKEGTRAVMRG